MRTSTALALVLAASSSLLTACLADDDDAPGDLSYEDDKADGFGTPAGDPLDIDHVVDLAKYDGQPFLAAMLEDKTGIKAQLDADYKTTYKVPSWTTVRKGVQNFDTKVVRKIGGAFSTSTGMHDFAISLKGKSFTPASAVSVSLKGTPKPTDVYTVAEVLAMSAGAGVLVQIDEHNYYYNYGYKSGALADDVMSGRSFGASPGHRANDASDTFYLTELGKLLTNTEAHTDFFKVMFDVLTQSRLDDYSKMSDLAQTVETDFLAVYTAESDRHIMSKLVEHPWENDLAEVTMVSLWGTAVGKVMKAGKIVDGTPKDWWAKSEVSNRSGIGMTRTDRRALQRLITAYERTAHPELVKAIEDITGHSTDMFRVTLEYLNNPKFLTDRAALKAIPGADLTKAMADFLAQVRTDAKDMLASPAFKAVQ